MKLKTVTIFLIIIAILYSLWPYDLLPDVIMGWGWLDDLAFWGLLCGYIFSRGRKVIKPGTDEGHSEKAKNERRQDNGTNEKSSEGQFNGPRAADGFDPYQVLGVEKSASPKEIQSAYRKLANKYHPDKVLHLGDEFINLAEKRFKEIQKAYDMLVTK
jgi:DnaJ like chaperone protein